MNWCLFIGFINVFIVFFIYQYEIEYNHLKLISTSNLYEHEDEYFNTIIHYRDNWQNITNTSWTIPKQIHTKHPTIKYSKKWNYNIINYPIIPFFLKSKKQRMDDMITIVTQCSIDRLSTMTMMAKNWNGIISLSIYICLEDSIIQNEHIIYEFWKYIEMNTGSILDIHLLYEIDYKDNYTDYVYFSGMYPVNHLRNLALQCAQSEYVLLTDADFIPSNNLHSLAKKNYNDSLKIIEQYKYDILVERINNISTMNNTEKLQMIEQIDINEISNNDGVNNLALILPAFELKLRNDIRYSMDLIPLTKMEVVRSWNNGISKQFESHQCMKCHGATNYTKWIKNTTNIPYAVTYQYLYEPYILTKRVGIHRYDARFRGYGGNKMYHLASLDKFDNFYWIVSPDCFLYHIPHNTSRDQYNYRTKASLQQWFSGLKQLASYDLNHQHDASGYITS